MRLLDRGLLTALGVISLLLAGTPWVLDRVRGIGWVTYSGGLAGCGEGEDVVVDPRGSVWVACAGTMENAIFVFDGVTWTVPWRGTPLGVVHQSTDPAVRDVGVNGLAVGPDGRVWAAHEKAISVFDGAEWSMLRLPSSLVGPGTGREMGPDRPPFWPHVGAISVDGRGRVWLGTWDPIPEFKEGSAAAVGVFDGHTWTVYTPANSDLPRARAVNEILAGKDGRVWIALEEAPLASFDDAAWTLYPSMMDVNALAFDPAGQVWAQADGVYRLDGQRWTRVTGTKRTTGCCFPQHSLAIDARGRIWTMEGRSLIVSDQRAVHVLTSESSGLRTDLGGPEAIAIDVRGRLWVVTQGVQSYETGSSRLTVPAGFVALTRVWPFPSLIGAALWIVVLLSQRAREVGRRPAVALRGLAPGTRGAWARWTLATLAGMSIGWIAGLGVAAVPLARCRNDCDILALVMLIQVVAPGLFVVGGILAAILQHRLVLKEYFLHSGAWISLSAVGCVSLFGILWALQWDTRGTLSGLARVLMVAGPGPFVGIMQWLFLRRRVPQAGWWLLATALTLGTVWWFLVGVGGPLRIPQILPWGGLWMVLLSFLVEIVVIGVFVGAITGGVLLGLLRRRVSPMEPA